MSNNMRLIGCFFVFLISAGCVWAQLPCANVEYIRTMETYVNGEKQAIPCIELGSNDAIDFSFDDMNRSYHRYVYTIEHCDFQWKKSTRIFDSNYLRGSIRKVPIDSYTESLNTSVEYTHYQFTFPNEKLQIAYSGNYVLKVYDEDEKKDVCSFGFMVVENKVGIDVVATTNTEIDFNSKHQQLKISANASTLGASDCGRELKLVVVPNYCLKNAVWNPTPDYEVPNGLKWEMVRDLIFKAGNEYRKFEMTSVRNPLMGMDNIRWFKPYYHATLFPTDTKKNYVYDEEQDGQYYVRTTERANSDYEADYLITHFLLKHQPEAKGDIYIYGALTNWQILPEAKMEYNERDKMYEGNLLLKEGYYNYQYVYLTPNAEKLDFSVVEGDFYQTENMYTILVYYAQKGSRYNRLVGMRQFKFMPAKQ